MENSTFDNMSAFPNLIKQENAVSEENQQERGSISEEINSADQLADDQSISSAEYIGSAGEDHPAIDSNGKRIRKIRTTITKEKLMEMNRIFNEYLLQRESGTMPTLNLKQIGIQLGLGYSTILHKYREFRSNRKVKGGALICSLQKRRKYRKSLAIEQILQASLLQRPFFTAVELSKYIFETRGISFSRSIISRHLGQMGYSYKNLRQSPEEKNRLKYLQVRKIYADVILPLVSRNQKLIYIDQLTCSVEVDGFQQYVSAMIIATVHGILLYDIREGFFTRELFYSVLSDFLRNLRMNSNCRLLEGQNQELYLVMDMNRIHRDAADETPGIAALMMQQNAQLIYIPPCTPQLNPLQGIINRIREQLRHKTIQNASELWRQFQSILQVVKNEPTEPYFESINQWLLKCSQNESF